MGSRSLALLRIVRLAFSGATAGAALLGVFLPALGFSQLHAEMLGAGLGFAAVIAIKFAHLI
jgi:hypothetical protein